MFQQLLLWSNPFLIISGINEKNTFGTTGADAIKKFTPSLGIPYLGV